MRLKPAVSAVLVVVMIMAGALSGFALQFSDIEEAPWARVHIERMAEKGVVSGSDHPVTGQRIYRPNSPVTRVEAVVLVYSGLQKTNQLTSQTDYTEKYQTILSSAMIPDWAKRQGGYALENGIITMGDLSTFMRAGSPEPAQNEATREEVAVYFGKALDTDGDADATNISLRFLDTEQISSEALPYVNFLVEEGILSGDDQNRFNPRQTITRAEMAALANKTYNWLETKDEVVIDLSPVDRDDTSLTQMARREGTIQRVNQDTGVIFVLYEKEDVLEMHQVTDDTVIRINSLPHELIHLKAGHEAEFTFNDRKELLRIEINPHRLTYSGKIIHVADLLTYHAVVVESITDSRQQQTYRVDGNTEIIVNGVPGAIDLLREGDEVLVRYEGQQALSIEKGIVQQRDQILDGILDSAVNFSRTPYSLKMKGLDNQVREYAIDESVSVRIDGSRATLEELNRGDIVTITLGAEENHRIIRIVADTQDRSRNVEGTIDTLIIGRTIQVRFIDYDRQESTYTVMDGARVYMDDQRVDIRDLKLPVEAKMILKGDQVKEIEATRAFGSRVIQGRITGFRDSINMMTVRHLTTSGVFEEVAVYVTGSTQIIDTDGNETRLRNLTTNDEVFVTGEYDGEDLIADRVLVIQN